ncbi:MAG: ATP-dependent DNA ligase, partial [Microthrixaceae bacterium]
GRAESDELAVVVAALCGSPLQGRIGVGWATARIEGSATEPSLSVSAMDELIDSLAAAHGDGVQAERRRLLDDFGARATVEEADFVVRLLTGEMRQGALAGVVESAVAKAEGVPVGVVRRAAMLNGDLPATAVLGRTGGRATLQAVRLRLGVPVSPMLASTAPSVDEAVADLGPSSVQWKLDGIRVQAHVRGDRVRLFTRALNDITDRLPGIVSELAALDLPATVLDGEAIGEGADGRPAMFQDTVSDGTDSGDSESAGIETGAESGETAGWVMKAHWFDVLHHDGTDLLDEPLAARLTVLDAIAGHDRVESQETDDPSAAQSVLDASLAAGHEGVVLKDLGSPYAAGRRGKAWRKVKPVHTIDLVVMGVEWGSGRRQGTLSNLHLGALGPDGTPVMVGKTFKGLTDELLAWQTEQLLARETSRDGHIVWVRPELVVEIALDGVQRSTRYPGGVALRFARVRRYREDKSPSQADTIEAVRALLPT